MCCSFGNARLSQPAFIALGDHLRRRFTDAARAKLGGKPALHIFRVQSPDPTQPDPTRFVTIACCATIASEPRRLIVEGARPNVPRIIHVQPNASILKPRDISSRSESCRAVVARLRSGGGNATCREITENTRRMTGAQCATNRLIDSGAAQRSQSSARCSANIDPATILHAR